MISRSTFEVLKLPSLAVASEGTSEALLVCVSRACFVFLAQKSRSSHLSHVFKDKVMRKCFGLESLTAPFNFHIYIYPFCFVHFNVFTSSNTGLERLKLKFVIFVPLSYPDSCSEDDTECTLIIIIRRRIIIPG